MPVGRTWKHGAFQDQHLLCITLNPGGPRAANRFVHNSGEIFKDFFFFFCSILWKVRLNRPSWSSHIYGFVGSDAGVRRVGLLLPNNFFEEEGVELERWTSHPKKNPRFPSKHIMGDIFSSLSKLPFLSLVLIKRWKHSYEIKKIWDQSGDFSG